MVRATGFEPRSPACATVEPRRHSASVVYCTYLTHFRTLQLYQCMPGYEQGVHAGKDTVHGVSFVNRPPRETDVDDGRTDFLILLTVQFLSIILFIFNFNKTSVIKLPFLLKT